MACVPVSLFYSNPIGTNCGQIYNIRAGCEDDAFVPVIKISDVVARGQGKVYVLTRAFTMNSLPKEWQTHPEVLSLCCRAGC